MQSEFFLAVIVSIDAYLAAAAYCNSGIRIPAISAGIIAFCGAAVLGISIKFASVLGLFLPAGLLHAGGIAVLSSIGTLTILKSLLRMMTRRLSESGEMSLKIGKSPLVVKIYLDDTAADKDDSKSADEKAEEKEDAKPQANHAVPMLLTFLVIGGIGAGCYYKFKIVPEKKADEVDEDMEFEDDEDYVNEDDLEKEAASEDELPEIVEDDTNEGGNDNA